MGSDTTSGGVTTTPSPPTTKRSSAGRKLPKLTRPPITPLPLPLPLPPPSSTLSHHPSSDTCHAPSSTHSHTTSATILPSSLDRLALLGAGSQSKVYKAIHRPTGALYALKVIPEPHSSIRRHIIQETHILRTAHHRHITACHGVHETPPSPSSPGEVLFILEYMDGGTLADLYAAHPSGLSEPHLSQITAQVLAGLRYLHRRKVVHRDIKPSNLLLDRRLQEVKIGDFGVSTVLAHTLAQCTSFVGTCAYMSPERLNPDMSPAGNGGAYCGASADIWSLGVTLLEGFLGRFPVRLEPGARGDWISLVCAIGMGEPPAPPAHASPEFQDFVRVCLRRDWRARPTAEALLKHPFVVMYEGQPRSLAVLLRDVGEKSSGGGQHGNGSGSGHGVSGSSNGSSSINGSSGGSKAAVAAAMAKAAASANGGTVVY